MKYFISGHRLVGQDFFDKHYKPVLEKILMEDEDAEFVVGDYSGIDIMAQIWLRDNGLEGRTTVYHMFDTPKNCASPLFKTIGGFINDIERDTAMTKTSDKDVAFLLPGKWDSGTAQNILRRYEVSNR